MNKLSKYTPSVSFYRVWLAAFVGAGAYGAVLSLLVLSIFGATIFGALTTDVTTSAIAGVLLLFLLGPMSLFIVPVLTKSLVRAIARARVGLFWTFVAVLVGWTVATALSTLLWLIPGAQPFAALLVWAGATAITAWLIEKRSTSLTPTLAPPTAVADTASKRSVDALALPHQH